MADLKHVKGLSELQRILDQLPSKLEANVMRGALRAGGNVIKKEAQANVPVDSGTLRKGIKVSTRSRRGQVTARVRTTGEHGHVAGWVEFGTAAHHIEGPVVIGDQVVAVATHPGAEAKPFMRPALDAKATAAVVAAAEYMKKRLETKHGLDTSSVVIEADEE